jgi:hypothetical protein
VVKWIKAMEFAITARDSRKRMADNSYKIQDRFVGESPS